MNDVRVRKLLEECLNVFCDGKDPTPERVAEFLVVVARLAEEWKTRDLTTKPCCAYFNVDNLVYKDIYLPGIEEFVAHGYKRELYEEFLASWKKNIDEHGRP